MGWTSERRKQLLGTRLEGVGRGAESARWTGRRPRGTGTRDRWTGRKPRGTGTRDRWTGRKPRGTAARDRWTGRKPRGTGTRAWWTGRKPRGQTDLATRRSRNVFSPRCGARLGPDTSVPRFSRTAALGFFQTFGNHGCEAQAAVRGHRLGEDFLAVLHGAGGRFVSTRAEPAAFGITHRFHHLSD